MFDVLKQFDDIYKLQIFTDATELRGGKAQFVLRLRRPNPPSVFWRIVILLRSCFNEYVFIFFHCNLQRFLPLMFRPKCF